MSIIHDALKKTQNKLIGGKHPSSKKEQPHNIIKEPPPVVIEPHQSSQQHTQALHALGFVVLL